MSRKFSRGIAAWLECFSEKSSWCRNAAWLSFAAAGNVFEKVFLKKILNFTFNSFINRSIFLVLVVLGISHSWRSVRT